jgi:hypothetical protein
VFAHWKNVYVVDQNNSILRGLLVRAVIDGQFCIDISRDKYQRYIDVSTLTVDTMKNIKMCIINFDHGVMYACIRLQILQTNRKFLSSVIFVTDI